ncbi:MAG: hypothetical protein AB7G13_11655 [Lautropia sp.]
MLRFLSESHQYFDEHGELPAVSRLLEPLYRDIFTGIPAETMRAKAELGTCVHAACELDCLGTLDEASVDPAVAGYLAAWRRFRAEKRPEILAVEQRLAHPTLRYAGTLDLFARIDGIGWLIDWKATVSLHPPVALQLAAYKALLTAHNPEHRDAERAALRLLPDGTYRLGRYSDPADWPTFLGLLAVHNWKQRHV